MKLAGSLDAATAAELQRVLTPMLAQRVLDIVFDLARLELISSAGLRVFSMVCRKLRRRGGRVSFVNMQPQIDEVFEIVKALPDMRVFRNVAEFDAYIAVRQRSHEQSRWARNPRGTRDAERRRAGDARGRGASGGR